ncbi:hypothetical protein QFC22_002980 [Naganishia vaughanmartiniae]|uniref:Uncharacterized protein n=1 Tax=Naganishia vaughanmartiniae TaxID=1424756 RepID=A0ACC2X843_9TREE|nr:hypothetical protein QFC22_002980 [Naganishia vaughanmartiniae]
MGRPMQTFRKVQKPSRSSTSKPATPASTAVTAKADIDDIFAKPSTCAAPKVSTTPVKAKPEQISGDDTTSGKKKKKKSKSDAATEATPGEQTPASANARSKRKMDADPIPTEAEHTPEVAVFTDPSAAPSSSTKKQKVTGPEKAVKSREQMVKDDEEERMFRDSRGDGPRRKTEEGFFIFKEAELNIRPESGGKSDLLRFHFYLDL